MTVQELFKRIWDAHWNKDRFITSGWALEARRLFDGLIAPTFSEKCINALTASQIRAWHLGLIATPIQANRALGVFSKMLSFAEEREWRAQGTNLCKLIKPYKEKKRKRFATPDELNKVAQILDQEAGKNPRAVAFIYTLLFSGARPRSIERATWDELETIEHENQTFGVLTFYGKSTAATGDDEQVIIPPQAMKLLGPKKSEGLILGIKMPKDFWQRIRKQAGCEDLQARDLRRTFATIGLSNGLSLSIIGELLNHHSASTTMIYGKLLNGKRIEATKAIADHMTKLFKGGDK